jgi:YbgC/YbaW family acyl-CoA thioester hydrolase
MNAANLPARPELVVPIEVYYFDTDAAGVVHNVAYLRMIEVARTKLADHLGWSLTEMHSTGLVPVVTRTEIDYLKPAKLGEVLEIHSRITGIEKVRFNLEFVMIRKSDAVEIARCRQVMVTVQLPQGRPQPVPEAWSKAYSVLLS